MRDWSATMAAYSSHSNRDNLIDEIDIAMTGNQHCWECRTILTFHSSNIAVVFRQSRSCRRSARRSWLYVSNNFGLQGEVPDAHYLYRII